MLPVVRCVTEQLRQHPDAGSLKRLGVEPFHEPRKWTVRQNSGGRVGRVCPYGRVQPDGEVHRSAGQGPTYVLRVRQGDDPVDAREALGRTETEQVVVGCWNTNRSAGVAAPADGCEAGRDRRTGPTARAARVPGGVVRVTRLTSDRADGRDAHRQLVQVGFSQNDGPGLP